MAQCVTVCRISHLLSDLWGQGSPTNDDGRARDKCRIPSSADRFEARRYQSISEVDPAVLPAGGGRSEVVIRGGGLIFGASECKSTHRRAWARNAPQAVIGFRVYCRLTPEVVVFALKAAGAP